MLDALLVLVEGDDIGDGLFLTLIVTDDKLQFDTHRRLLRVRVAGEGYTPFYRTLAVSPSISMLSPNGMWIASMARKIGASHGISIPAIMSALQTM